MSTWTSTDGTQELQNVIELGETSKDIFIIMVITENGSITRTKRTVLM